MSEISFTVEDIGPGCWAVNDGGRTAAYVTSQGYIDWLLKSPLDDGPRLTSLKKETHLSYTLGLKLLLFPPHLCEKIVGKKYEIMDGGARLRLSAVSRSKDGNFEAYTEAVLSADEMRARYFWTCRSCIACTADEPVNISGVEYNNIYPGKCGRCFMFAPDKEFDRTLITDRDGAVWEFPHQHLMHYGGKLEALRFAEGSVAGFFGREKASPVVEVLKASHEPFWGICDMYYDLHCMARIPAPVEPGRKIEFEYLIKYLSDKDSAALKAKARRIPVTEEDRERHDYPRLALGMNSFMCAVDIGGADDSSGFRQKPPHKVWDREAGHRTKGSLRLWNDKGDALVWSAEPPTQIPAKKLLKIKALVKTEGAEGRGLFIRLRYHTFVWHPTPHVEWTKTLESKPVNGSTGCWLPITVPSLEVPEEDFDYLLWFDVVLEGKGTAWVTDVDIDLQDAPIRKAAESVPNFASAGGRIPSGP